MMMAKWKKGGPEADSFTGTDKADYYMGLGGQDAISGFGGNDKLKGGTENDGIVGGDGNDKIWGEDGFDIITGDAGKDLLWGGAETDAFVFRVGGKFGVGSDIDIIKDIDTKGKDMDDIQIMSLDFTNQIDSFSDVMKFARQDGKHVKIDFGSGDILILENTKKAALTAELFMFDM
jgi:Ca2+-binding RTX toxin-like protein